MIDEARLEAAMLYLADTDLAYGTAKGELVRSEILVERAKARVFLIADGNVEERKSIAKTSSEVTTAEDAYIDAVTRFEHLRARRQRAELVIEVWRSLEASRRKAAFA